MYTPRTPPPQWDPQWFAQEQQNIREALSAPVKEMRLTPIYALPSRIYEGMFVEALAPLNLGSGDGTYQYRGGAWRFWG